MRPAHIGLHILLYSRGREWISAILKLARLDCILMDGRTEATKGPRMRWRLLGTLGAVALSGCGKPSPSATSDPAPPAAVATGQDTARKTIPLLIFPLTLSVPQDWNVYPPIRPSFLTGPAPDGNLQISISMLEFMNSQRMNGYISGAQDLSDRHPQRTQVRQLTVKSGLRAVETITYSNPGGGASSRPSTQPQQTLSWNMVVFVPYQQKFIPCSFDLLGMTQQQYTDDEPLLRSIVDSAQPGDVSAFQ
jgi:hypothetical protein